MTYTQVLNCIEWKTVPHNELANYPRSQRVLGIRHDVDFAIGTALQMAEAEAKRGIRATYYLLTTAHYAIDKKALVTYAQQIQDRGHEVGLHLDMINIRLLKGDVHTHLVEMMELFRGAGIKIDGWVGHGSDEARKYKFDGRRFFMEKKEVFTAYGYEIPLGEHTESEYGMTYYANALDREMYWSDNGGVMRSDARTRAELDVNKNVPEKQITYWRNGLGNLVKYLSEESKKTICLLHPCYWKV